MLITRRCLYALGASLLCVGCAHESSSADFVGRYINAVRSDDARMAYRMLTAELRAEVSFQQFKRRWDKNRAEMLDRARALERVADDPSVEGYSDGLRFRLEREEGRWYVDVREAPFRPARTPALAIERAMLSLQRGNLLELKKYTTRDFRRPIDRSVAELLKILAGLEGASPQSRR